MSGIALQVGSYSVLLRRGLILLFGAVMSFSTRTVASNFSDSRPTALSIYNVCFCAVIVVPIALLQTGILPVVELVGFCSQSCTL